jgi:hypothetical protein
MPKTDSVDPRRTKLRRDIVDPNLAKSKTDSEEPKRRSP